MNTPSRNFGDAFEAWADLAPDALAVVCDDGRRLTYGELERQANRIANAIDDRDPHGRFPTIAIATMASRP